MSEGCRAGAIACSRNHAPLARLVKTVPQFLLQTPGLLRQRAILLQKEGIRRCISNVKQMRIVSHNIASTGLLPAFFYPFPLLL